MKILQSALIIIMQFMSLNIFGQAVLRNDTKENPKRIFSDERNENFSKGQLKVYNKPISLAEKKLFKQEGNEIFSENFEADTTTWSFWNGEGVWEIGTPTSGPMQAYSGLKCAATNLDGNYPSNTWDGLYSPIISIPTISSSREKIYLRFYNWFELESGYDFGRIYITTDNGGNWAEIFSVSGSSNGWIESEVDLSQYAGMEIYFVFLIDSDSSLNYNGWYVDDVIIETESQTEWIVETGVDLDKYVGWLGNSKFDVYDPPLDFDILINEDISTYTNFALIISAYDVDADGVGACSGIPEVDNVYFNGYYVGKLTGTNNSWSISTFEIKKEWVKSGTLSNPGINEIVVYVDVLGKIENCEEWAVEIDWAAISPINSSSNGVGFSTSYSDQGVDENGNGKYDYLDIVVTVNVDPGSSGNFNMNGVLKTGNELEITWDSKEVYLESGQSEVILRFSGKDINSLGIDGPYHLKNTTIYQVNNPNINGWIIDAYNTQFYSYTNFETASVITPHVIQKKPEDGARVEDDIIIQTVFNTDMMGSTINTNTFIIRKDGNSISGTVNYEASTRTGTFTPGNNLEKGAQYQVTVSTDVKSAEGINLPYVETWSFTVNPQTPVIFIPGIMGSPLFDDTNNNGVLEFSNIPFTHDEFIWVDQNQLGWFGDSFLDVLRLQDDGESPFDSNYRIFVAPLRNDQEVTIERLLDFKPLSYYEDIIDQLDTSSIYELDDFNDDHNVNENLYVFTYDWRKSGSFNAQMLNELINNICNDWNKTDKVNIIAHSMGGIVSKRYIADYGTQKIKKLIFIGTPHQGAPKSYAAMMMGYMYGFVGFITTDKEIKEISRNMPSIYELLPTKDYHNTNFTNFWTLYGKDLYSNSLVDNNWLLSYDEIQTNLKNFVGKDNFTLNDNLVDNSNSFRNSISDLAFGDIEVYNIVGYNSPTIGRVDISYKNNGAPRINSIYNLDGDGTVPLKSAELINSAKTYADYYLNGVDHQDLPSNAADIIERLLQEPADLSTQNLFQLPYNHSYAFPNIHYASYANSTQAIVHSPVELHVYDSQGRHTGNINDTTWENEIPGSYFFSGNLEDEHSLKIAILPGGQNYRFVINSLTTNGSFDFNVINIDEGTVLKDIYFEEIPISINSISTANLDNSNFEIFIEMDENGDGNVDQVYQPTAVTSVDKNDRYGNISYSFELKQNYPNPFNPTTTISYSIPETQFVTLKIFDVLGKEVATLVNEEKLSGNYEIKFNGGGLPSGVYFYRLRVGNFVQTKKLLLLK
ncbi:MAG: alpha/beta fold hydrolase [Bacteroidota bacterium]